MTVLQLGGKESFNLIFRFSLDDLEHGMKRFTVECKGYPMFSILITEKEALQLYFLGVPVYEEFRRRMQKEGTTSEK